MTFLNPEGILQETGIFQPGMKVGDFGCGAGYFSIPLAKIVGEEGHVFAVDVLQSALDALSQKASLARMEGIITPIRANLEKTGATNIPNASLQVVVLANILFQSDQKEAVIAEAKRVLTPGGFLVVIDWNPDASLGPKGYKISKEDVRGLLSSAGFTLKKEFPVDSYHYGLLFNV